MTLAPLHPGLVIFEGEHARKAFREKQQAFTELERHISEALQEAANLLKTEGAEDAWVSRALSRGYLGMVAELERQEGGEWATLERFRQRMTGVLATQAGDTRALGNLTETQRRLYAALDAISRADVADAYRWYGLAMWSLQLAKRDRYRTAGAKGGRQAKRRRWADVVAEKLALNAAAKLTKDQAWNRLPDSRDPWKFEFDDAEIIVYRDGDKLCAEQSQHDDRPAKPAEGKVLTTLGSITKGTFQRNFYPPRKTGM